MKKVNKVIANFLMAIILVTGITSVGFAKTTTNEEVTNKIVVSIAGADTILEYSNLGLNFDSPEHEVLNAIRPVIQEEHGVDIRDNSSGWLYKTRKAVNSQNIHVIANSTAG